MVAYDLMRSKFGHKDLYTLYFYMYCRPIFCIFALRPIIGRICLVPSRSNATNNWSRFVLYICDQHLVAFAICDQLVVAFDLYATNIWSHIDQIPTQANILNFFFLGIGNPDVEFVINVHLKNHYLVAFTICDHYLVAFSIFHPSQLFEFFSPG